MEYVVVTYPETRDVYMDGQILGETGKTLAVEQGSHVFDLGGLADYDPPSRAVNVTDTSSVKPIVVAFTPSNRDHPPSRDGGKGGSTRTKKTKLSSSKPKKSELAKAKLKKAKLAKATRKKAAAKTKVAAVKKAATRKTAVKKKKAPTKRKVATNSRQALLKKLREDLKSTKATLKNARSAAREEVKLAKAAAKAEIDVLNENLKAALKREQALLKMGEKSAIFKKSELGEEKLWKAKLAKALKKAKLAKAKLKKAKLAKAKTKREINRFEYTREAAYRKVANAELADGIEKLRALSEADILTLRSEGVDEEQLKALSYEVNESKARNENLATLNKRLSQSKEVSKETLTETLKHIARTESEDPSVEQEGVAEVNLPKHVNVTFTRIESGETVPKTTSLAAGRDYCLRINIGLLLPETLVDKPKRFPEQHLPSNKEGNWLEIVVASEDFLIKRARYALFLPVIGESWVCQCSPSSPHECEPKERNPFLDIRVRASMHNGTTTLRLAVYYLKNLVQSQVVTAQVRTNEETAPAATSIIDYSLSAALSRLDRMPARSFNVLTNDNDNGSHLIVINGATEDAIIYQLTEGKIRNAITGIRQALLSIHIEEFGGKLGAKPQQRPLYDKRNAKAQPDFEADLKKLAVLGRRLWTSLFPEREVRKSLKNLLHDPAKVQVARMGISNFVFPWALVYEIPLETGKPEAHTICPWVGEWYKSGPGKPIPLRCPREADHTRNTICPFGFWGIRHIIEQPPSMPKGRELKTKIAVANATGQMVVGLSTDLDAKLTSDHLQNLEKIMPSMHVSRCPSRKTIEEKLENSALELIYFYCHGKHTNVRGQDQPLPYLEVGEDERITPDDIITWDDRWTDDHWDETSPLIFINGCHTTDVTPETLVNFVDTFVGVWASGVIGTETSVHQRVANEAAETFWGYFQGSGQSEGDSVGMAMRKMRLHFLRKGNVMGLTYTAYCSADLGLKH